MTQCPCDLFEHPLPLAIPAGLTTIPRQIAGFPEFRRAMLAAIRRYPALYHWRARSDDDFGIMLLEMWAYVADVQSFYDEVIAHEIGHCIGFRHTDYMNRSSCGQNVNEGTAGVGAIHIPGTPTTVSGNYKSWMMACTDGSPNFSSTDKTALEYVY